MITEQQYKAWQVRLAAHNFFRRWWQFWSNYTAIFFVIAGVILLYQHDSYKILVLSVIAFIVSRAIVITLINFGVHRQRPYQKYTFEPITSRFFSYRTEDPNSFPSRHVTALSSVASVVFLFNPMLGAVLFAVTIITGVARIVLGYHYSTDVVGGLIIGTLVGFSTVYWLSSVLFT